MTLPILSGIVAFLFVSIMFIYSKLQKTRQLLLITMEQALINTTMISIIAKALTDKKILSLVDLQFLKKEEQELEKVKAEEDSQVN